MFWTQPNHCRLPVILPASLLQVRSDPPPSWSGRRANDALFHRVLLDDTDLHGRSGGEGYAKYGLDEHAGAIVVVRPDGYVGMVAPLEGVKELNGYFESFLL